MMFRQMVQPYVQWAFTFIEARRRSRIAAKKEAARKKKEEYQKKQTEYLDALYQRIGDDAGVDALLERRVLELSVSHDTLKLNCLREPAFYQLFTEAVQSITLESGRDPMQVLALWQKNKPDNTDINYVVYLFASEYKKKRAHMLEELRARIITVEWHLDHEFSE